MTSAFKGNPQAKITAINVSGGLTLSRTSGKIPAQVYVSIQDITVTGTIVDANGDAIASATPIPFCDLEVSFDFGDPTGTELFVDQRTSLTVNANWQPGPAAAYLYRVADTYTITAKIRAKNGNSYTTATVTADFTASAFTPAAELWFDSTVAGTGTGTQLDPYKLLSSANNTWVNNTRWNLKRGSVFLISDNANNRINFRKAVAGDLDGLRVQAYGTGNDPEIRFDTNASNSTVHPITGGNGAAGAGAAATMLTDVVISDIKCVVESGCTNISEVIYIKGVNEGTGSGDGTIANITLDNVTLVSESDQTLQAGYLGSGHEWPSTGLLIWGCTAQTPLSSPGNNRMGWTLQSWYQWVAMVGGYIEGGGANVTLDHHIYPIVKEDSLWRWIYFGPSATGGGSPTRNYCVNMDWNPVNYGYGSSCSVSGTTLTVGGTISGAFQTGMALNFGNGGASLDVTISSFGTGTGGAGTYNLSGAPTGGNFSGQPVNGAGTGTPETSRRHVFCSNYASGVKNLHDAGDAVNEPRNTQFREFVAQFNYLDELTDGGFSPSGAIVTYTVRFNKAINTTAPANARFSPALYSYVADQIRLALYGNEFDIAGSGAIVFGSGAKGIMSQPNAITVVDNIMYSRAATGYLVNIHFNDTDVAVIDRNTYYMPSGPGSGLNFNQNNGSAVSWSSWMAQGFDPNGSNVAVSWTQGEFGVPAGRVNFSMRSG